MAPKHAVFWSTLVGLVALDQATKRWIVATLPDPGDEIVVIPHLVSLVQAQNPGAAFSMLHDAPWRYAFFAVFTVIVVAALLGSYWRADPRDRLLAGAIGTLLAGALGNAIDRVEKRTVTDFVKVYTDHPAASAWLEEHVGMSVWPMFNVADAALLFGLLLFLVHALTWDGDDELGGDELA